MAETLLAATMPLLLGACAATSTATAISDMVAAPAILIKSNPANGSTVVGPVNQLELWFNPPARLREVIIIGPEGAMPMMVTAAGDVGQYSLPLSHVGPGSYTVTWKATVRSMPYNGYLQFYVR